MLKINHAGILAVLAAICCFRAGDCCGGFAFVDPGIPAGETITYTNTIDNVAEQIKERVEIQSCDNRSMYVITSEAPRIVSTVTIDKKSMKVLSLRIVRSCGDTTVESETKVSGAMENAESDSIRIPHFIALKHLLRGYPFEKMDRLRIDFYGNEKSSFNMIAVFKKKESLTLNSGKKFECYRIDVEVAGFWGTIMPRLRLWYAQEPPHPLVRARGPTGSLSSPDYDMTMTDYWRPRMAP